MRVVTAKLDFEREELTAPFGFKGGAVRELWQPRCLLEDENGVAGLGLGVQSVLWSGAGVFAAHTPCGGNTLMLAVTEYALGWLTGRRFAHPPQALEALLPHARRYARAVTQQEDLPETFILNALVPVDFALWQLYAAGAENREHPAAFAQGFEALTAGFTAALNARQPLLGNIPLISYNKTLAEIRGLLEEGAFLLKIKIGADPAGDGDPSKMLAWDKARLTEIHNLAEHYPTDYTDCGRPVYYLDANGRYASLAQAEELLRHAERIGAMERIVLLEEPFAEENRISVKTLPVLTAADESAHRAEDLEGLAARGYGAVALKPVAKTLSVSLAMLNEAARLNMHCFCADLTVPPAMLVWNMNVAARLPRLPGLKAGVVESNGAQNYRGWAQMLALAGAETKPWLYPQNGVYTLSASFYQDHSFLRPLPGYRQGL